MIAMLIASQFLLMSGLELVANDPFVSRWGPALGLEYRPTEWLGIQAAGGYYPNLGESAWSPLMQQLVDENQVTPGISRITSRERLAVQWIPVRTASETVQSEVGLFMGGGLTQTLDDLALLGVPKGSRDTERQSHPTFSWGVTASVRKDRIGFRVRFEESRYREDFAGSQEKKVPVWFGADFVLWQG